MNKIITYDIIKEFNLKIENKNADINREITSPGIHRLGLELAGVYESTHSEKQIIGWGTKESKWFSSLKVEEAIFRMKRALVKTTPLLILSNGIQDNIYKLIYEVANELGIPIVKLTYHLSYAVSTIGWFLANKLAPSIDIHGSLVSLYGVGVMIVGPSGIGKSEAVLELLQNGHLFISDDTVIVTRIGNEFIGKSAFITKGYLEARGIGLIDIQHMYGAQTVKEQSNIELVVELVPSEQMNNVDRLGNMNLKYEILNGQIPKIQIPVNYGRSVSALIKAATSAFISKKHGMNPLKEIKKRTKNGGEDE